MVHFLWVLAVFMVILHVPWTIWGFVPGVLLQLAGMIPTMLAMVGAAVDSKVACRVLADGRTLVTLDVPVPSRKESAEVDTTVPMGRSVLFGPKPSTYPVLTLPASPHVFLYTQCVTPVPRNPIFNIQQGTISSSAGNYYFVRVPALGPEFHPFSVASYVAGTGAGEVELPDVRAVMVLGGDESAVHPGTGISISTSSRVSFCIGAIGPLSWTGKLAAAAAAAAGAGGSGFLSVQLQGTRATACPFRPYTARSRASFHAKPKPSIPLTPPSP